MIFGEEKSMLDEETLPHDPKFKYIDNIIHVDEKWFNMTKKSRNFYLLLEEQDPYRMVQNKNSIEKVTFLSEVARPRFNNEGNCILDEKLGVWAFVRNVVLYELGIIHVYLVYYTYNSNF